MAINFPDSPSVNDTHTVGDRTWVWDGTVWSVVVGSIPTTITELTINDDLTVDTSTLHVDSANNRVGVGTTSPDDSLHVVGDVTIEVSDDGSAAQPEVTLHRGSTTPADGDYLGQFKFAGKNDAGQTVNYAKITGKISDVTDTTEDGLIEIANISGGSQSIGYRFTSTDLKLLNGRGLEVAGDVAVDTDTLYVDTTNDRVGINTSSPSNHLTVASPSGNASAQIMAASGSYPQLFFGDGGTNQWHIESTPGGGALYFLETGVDYVMTFLAGGNVGIGTQSPSKPLHVYSATLDQPAIFESGDSRGGIELKDSATVSSVLVGAVGDDFRVYAGGGDKFTVTSGGNVGIGTTSPSKELDVHGASNPEIRILSTDASDPAIVFGDSVDGARASIYYDTSANDLLFRGYNNSTRMTIDSDGKVGIGRTDPDTLLHVNGAVTISSDTGVGNTHFPFTDGRFYYTADPETGGTGDHVFRHYSGGSYVEQMRILENGNVGIGDSSPSYKLDVNGTGGFMDRLFVQANGSDILRLRDTGGTDTGGYIAFEQSGGTRMGYIGWGNNDDIHIRNENSGGNMFFGVQAGWAAYFNTNMDFVPYVDSAREIGSSSLRWQKGWFDVIDVADEIYVGGSGRGDSQVHFHDDNSNTWRTLMWDDSANHFYFEGNIQINGTKLQDPGSANNLRVQTAHGYLDLGPQNSTYCHIYTDRAQFYTNKGFNSVPFIYWRNNSGIAGPLIDTSTGTGYRYVFQNQTYGTFYDYSSIRARKEQIVNVTEADAGRWIDALQPVTFIERWMGEGEEPEDNKAFREADMQVGFIADDILDNPDTTHFSQVLDNGEGGFDPAGWKWECVIAAAVAEIKALRGREAALEARIAALEAG